MPASLVARVSSADGSQTEVWVEHDEAGTVADVRAGSPAARVAGTMVVAEVTTTREGSRTITDRAASVAVEARTQERVVVVGVVGVLVRGTALGGLRIRVG
jgi:hypothetical protein